MPETKRAKGPPMGMMLVQGPPAPDWRTGYMTSPTSEGAASPLVAPPPPPVMVTPAPAAAPPPPPAEPVAQRNALADASRWLDRSAFPNQAPFRVEPGFGWKGTPAQYAEHIAPTEEEIALAQERLRGGR